MLQVIPQSHFFVMKTDIDQGLVNEYYKSLPECFWRDLSEDERKSFTRKMQLFFNEMTDKTIPVIQLRKLIDLFSPYEVYLSILNMFGDYANEFIARRVLINKLKGKRETFIKEEFTPPRPKKKPVTTPDDYTRWNPWKEEKRGRPRKNELQ